MDTACKNYINYANKDGAVDAKPTKTEETADLSRLIVKGIKDGAISVSKELLKTEAPLDIINNRIIPALNEIGTAFEEKKAFLPQLLMSAEAASGAFDEIKAFLPSSENNVKGEVILATVKGDIHDIGKNIVKVLLQSYGFKVYDLGRDVAPEAILEEVKNTDCNLVGLSALMTTTVPAMAETISLLHKAVPSCKIMVGGAVLNQEYSEMINADFYGKDAMDSVHITQEFYGK